MNAIVQYAQHFFDTPVHIAIAAIYALLIFASVISFTLRKLQPGEAHTELSRRVKSWWWMITVFTVARGTFSASQPQGQVAEPMRRTM